MPLISTDVFSAGDVPWRSGGIYPLSPSIGGVVAPSAVDTIMLRPFILGRAATITGLGVRVSTGGAGSSIKVGIWRHNPLTGRPTGTPIASNNTGLATSTNNTTVILDVTGRLSKGVVYWAGGKFTGILPTVVTVSNGFLDFLRISGDAPTSTVASNITGLSAPSTYSDDIADDDLTSAVFTNVTSTGATVFYMRT